MDKETRNRIQRATQAARELLEHEYGEQLEGTFDILPDGTIKPEPGPHLDAEQRILRQKLVAAVEHQRASGMKADEAVAAYLREAAFTTLNRFVALKMLEARDLVQECISRGEQSSGFKEFTGLAPGLVQLLDHGYQLYIESLFDEIGREVRVLFDRRDPASLLWPRRQALIDLLALLNTSNLTEVWKENETIGWVYQYYNRKEERDAMRKASRSPRSTVEMAVRNQFFTPRYIVEFLTDNTLGRIWYEMQKGNTNLTDECQYLIRPPNEIFLVQGEKIPTTEEKEANRSQEELLKKPIYIEHRTKKDPRDLGVLDPACGSGHFLLYAFDLLERIYEEAWADPESPKSEATGCTLRQDFETLDGLRLAVPKMIIEHNLCGIDIDPRAVQIAAMALWLRAQKAWKKLGLQSEDRPRIKKSNIVTAEPMPGAEDMRREFTGGLKPRVLGQLVDVMFDKMKLAGEAGPLLRIEEEIKDAIAEARKQWMVGPTPEQQLLFPTIAEGPNKREPRFDVKDVTDERFWEQAEHRILEALKNYAEQAENGHAVRRRLFAEDAARGFAFIDLCRKQYDVILMNPPFGASSRESKNYIDEQYPNSKGDVLANFIERTLQLTNKPGLIGAISSRTPFFLGSFEPFRSKVLRKTGHVSLLADLGEGVLEAMVETASYVLTRSRRIESESIFLRLLIDLEKEDTLQQLTSACLLGAASQKIFFINPANFDLLRGKPYAYWVTKSTIKELSSHPSIDGSMCSIRVGLQTSDDFRFLRLLWEVPAAMLVQELSDDKSHTIAARYLHRLTHGKRWVPFSKTDVAMPWYSPITLVANWARGGSEIKAFAICKGYSPSRNVRSEGNYFWPGFSYMARTTRLVPYIVPAGVIPTAGRSQVFPNQGKEYGVLGICASNVGSAVARFCGGSFARPMFQASMVQGLPACDFPVETLDRIREHVDAEVNKRRAVVQHYEPFQEFTLPAWVQSTEGVETTWDLYSLFGRDVENKIAKAFGIGHEQLADLERDIREAVSIRGPLDDIESENVDEEPNDDEQKLNVELIADTLEEKAIGLFMYAFGIVFGRWDVRIARDPSLAPKLPDPFDPLPICPPGMLVGPDGLAAEPSGIASEQWLRAMPDANTRPLEGSVESPTIDDSIYPFDVAWGGIVIDDPGHSQDLIDAVQRALRAVFKEEWDIHLQKAVQCLNCSVSDLRRWYASAFFSEHLKRYTKSRRKAPIYWQLATLSGNYSVWLYYHRFTKDTFYKVFNEYAVPKLQHEERKLVSLVQAAGGSPTASQRKEIAAQEAFVDELRVFRDEVARIAPLWNPNLNDGVIINFAPLWRLVPQHRAWQTECKACWDKLVAGDYDWSHLAMHLWPERVVPKCAKDRSLAIAHDLEDVFWSEDSDGKWKPRQVSKETVEELITKRTSPSVKAALQNLLAAPVSNGRSTTRRTSKARRSTKRAASAIRS